MWSASLFANPSRSFGAGPDGVLSKRRSVKTALRQDGAGSALQEGLHLLEDFAGRIFLHEVPSAIEHVELAVRKRLAPTSEAAVRENRITLAPKNQRANVERRQLIFDRTDRTVRRVLVADGKIYLMNFSSQVFVYDAESGEKLGDVSMDKPYDDYARSAIVAAHGQLFIRTPSKLYCIAK